MTLWLTVTTRSPSERVSSTANSHTYWSTAQLPASKVRTTARLATRSVAPAMVRARMKSNWAAQVVALPVQTHIVSPAGLPSASCCGERAADAVT